MTEQRTVNEDSFPGRTLRTLAAGVTLSLGQEYQAQLSQETKN